MTKRDYEVIAKALSEHRKSLISVSGENDYVILLKSFTQLTKTLSNHFEKENEQFNETKFFNKAFE